MFPAPPAPRERQHLLWVLGTSGPSTQQALAAALEVTPRNPTGLVDGLVASGHVTRQPHPSDRRAALVTPTEHGARAYDDLVAAYRDLAARLFADVDPERLAVFADVALLVVGVWGVLWMLGLLASMRVRPHALGDADLLVRSGARTRVVVPVAAIAETRGVTHELPGLVRTLHEDDGLLLVGLGSETNLELVLSAPTTLTTSAGPHTVSRVGLWVDDPRETAALLRRRRSAPLR